MLLKIENLAASYGHVKALFDVSISVGEGELVALVGANGAGKTTLMKVVSGLQPAAGGSVHFEGKDITRLASDKRVQRGISQVPEGRQVFAPMTVADNLRLGAFSRSKADINAEMDHIYNVFPVLRERRMQLAGTLSGGEQQMLAIGRAMMAKPRLLLLDEPSMGLSPLLVEQTFNIIKTLSKQGTTIFLVEQNAYMALSIADRGYVMENGCTTLSGKGRELLEDDRVKQAYLAL